MSTLWTFFAAVGVWVCFFVAALVIVIGAQMARDAIRRRRQPARAERLIIETDPLQRIWDVPFLASAEAAERRANDVLRRTGDQGNFGGAR